MVEYRRMRLRHAELSEDPKDIPSSTRKYIREVPRAYCRGVLNLLKARRCSGKFIKGSVVTTLHLEP
jgi:hypothetical protein